METTRPVTLIKGLLDWSRPNSGWQLHAAMDMAFTLGTADFSGLSERDSLAQDFDLAKVASPRNRCANMLIDEVIKHLHSLHF